MTFKKQECSGTPGSTTRARLPGQRQVDERDAVAMMSLDGQCANSEECRHKAQRLDTFSVKARCVPVSLS